VPLPGKGRGGPRLPSPSRRLLACREIP
jgi:hypothetical protein